MTKMCEPGDDLDYLLPANCPSPYQFDSWDRHNSIAFSATKGLRNAPGENNCFVNCAVQVFWHLDVFRRSYRRLLGHTCMGNSCIFCALKVIFTQFQYSDKTSLHPDALRKALAETFANQQRFQLGHMDDAAECFENILRRIHFHIAKNHSEDACTAPHCLPHQKFSMAVYEKVVCPCGASSSPLKFSEMVHYVSASALVTQSRMMQENGDVLHPDRFGLLLRKASAMGDVRNCPAGCGKQVQKQRTLLNIPDVVSVGLVWDSDHPNVEITTEVAGALGTAILLQDMYHRVMPDIRILPRLQLVALVCYYGKHYSTFVFHSKLRTWIYFDDATVREIGPQWENVVEKCSRGRFQPLLLLYANPNATPISVDSAPRKRVMAPGFAPMPVVMPPEDSSDSGLDRTRESIKSSSTSHNSRRSSTPSRDIMSAHDASQGVPDASHSHRSVTPCIENAANQETGRDSPARLTREHSRQPSFLFAVTGKEKNKLGEGGENGSHLPGGASSFAGQYVNGREQKVGLSRPLLDGGASSGRLDSMPEDNYADYTLSSGDQYRRPSLNGFDPNQLPLPPNVARYPDKQRKESFNKCGVGKDSKGGADIVRYQVDASRATNRTPDFSMHGDGYSPQKGGHMVDGPHTKSSNVVNIRPRHNSLSGRDDERMDGVEHSSSGQHVVVKPKPTGHNHHDAVDGSKHTPVQSGLATLPRKKGLTLSEPASSHQEASKPSGHYVEPPLPPGTPPPEYNSVVDTQYPHSRQTSTSSQASTIKASSSMGQIEQTSSSKKAEGDKQKKKVKKEKKSEKDPSKKSEKKKSAKSDLRKSESAHDLTDKSRYIDRRMVESILKHQGVGVHRQNSSCSVSSAESDSLMGKLLSSKAGSNLTVDITYDNVSLGSHKDSGYGSSDRNSSSSTGSGTIDPYAQYFISKSMVVPRSVNQQALEQYQQYGKGLTDIYTGVSAGQHHASHHHHHHGKDAAGLPQGEGRKIMHPIKESSQEDFLRLSLTDEPIGTQKFIIAPPATQADPRPPPVPPKNFAQFHVIKSSQSAVHQRESSLDSLDKDENINDRFVALCKKADSLMDNCMLAETQEDMAASLCYCESALGCLKEAMAQKDLNSRALAYVQKKNNSCLLKSRSLQKRMPAVRQESNQSTISSDMSSSVGNRSSITSSDSDMSDHMAKQLRLDAARERQNGNHERQGSSSHLRADNSARQGQGMNGAPYCVNGIPAGHRNSPSHSPQENGSGQQRTDSGTGRMPTSLSANYISNNTSSGDSAGSTADLYGTLPRNKSRKPSSDTATGPEVYQSFLNKQKCLQAGVHSSQQSLDSVKSDSGGSDHSSANGGRKSKSEIRQLLQENMVQRQWQQGGVGDQQGSRASPQLSQPSHPAGRHVPQQQKGGSYPSHQHGPCPPQQQGGQYTPQQQGGQYPPQQQGGQYPPQQQGGQYLPQQQGGLYPPQQQCGQYPPQQQGGQYPPQQQGGQYPPQQQGGQYPPQQQGGQYPPQQQGGQYPPQQQGGTQHPQQGSQYQQQQQRQGPHSRQTQPAPPSWQHQHYPPQQQQQQHYPPPPSSQQQQHYHQQPSHHQQQMQQQTASSNHHQNGQSGRHPSSGFPPPPPGVSMAPQSSQQNSQSAPHLPPGQKPVIPYPSSIAKSRTNTGPAVPDRPDPVEVGRRVPTQNVARVAPNTHMSSPRPAANASGGSYLVMMPPSSHQQQQQQLPPGAGQMRHAASSMHLAGLVPAGARPLERCASQPDCQKLVDSAYPANLPDAPSSVYSGREKLRGPPGSMSALQPDVRASPVNGHSAANGNTDDEASSSAVSVRALASRFETSDSVPAGSRQCSQNVSSDSAEKSPRTRSKSESFSRKPKSVLKNKKNKNRQQRKSVTFGESVTHYTDCDEPNSGYESARELSTPRCAADDRAYYSDDEERLGSHFSDNDLDDVEDNNSSNSDDSPVSEEDACQLCRKRRMDPGTLFCAQCSFYMSKLKSN